MALGFVVGVAIVPGLDVIKKQRRSDSAMARRIGMYRHRRDHADTALDHMVAAFELFRGHAKHVPDQDQQVLADRFVVFVENTVAATTKGR